MHPSPQCNELLRDEEMMVVIVSAGRLWCFVLGVDLVAPDVFDRRPAFAGAGWQELSASA